MKMIKDIIAEMRKDMPRVVDAKVILRNYADRIEAAHKRKVDRIHQAMVLIAGIEIENSQYPPRLWTALEDAYDALCDALGTDGDTSSDVEEAKAIGRHFVVKSIGNAAKMREALKCIDNIAKYLEAGTIRDVQHAYRNIQDRVRIALSTPARNCDLYTTDQAIRKYDWSTRPNPCEETEWIRFIDWLLAEAKGEAK